MGLFIFSELWVSQRCFNLWPDLLIGPMVIHNNFADFVLFLYVYIAFSDGDFHPLERAEIIEKMKKLYPEDASEYEMKIDETVRHYHDFEKTKLNSLFKDTFKHFSKITFNQRYRVYTDMYDILHADGKVDEAEMLALNALKEIIDITN